MLIPNSLVHRQCVNQPTYCRNQPASNSTNPLNYAICMLLQAVIIGTANLPTSEAGRFIADSAAEFAGEGYPQRLAGSAAEKAADKARQAAIKIAERAREAAGRCACMVPYRCPSTY